VLAPLVVAGVLCALAFALPRTTPDPARHLRVGSPVGSNLSPKASQNARYDISPFVTGPGAETVAGTGEQGFSGDKGDASAAELDAPGGLAEDRQGDLFIADTGNCRVREIPSHTGTQFSMQMEAGHIYTVAGGKCGTDIGRIGFATSVTVDSQGDLFIADPTNDEVYELPTSSGVHLGTNMKSGDLTVVAGSGSTGATGDGGAAIAARLDDPQGIGLDSEGDLLIADTENCEVREVAARNGVQWGIPMSAGDIYRIAGTGSCGEAGDGGVSTDAELWDPVDVAVGPSGDVAISDAGAEEILDLAPRTGSYYGITIDADHLADVAGIGFYGPYLVDGQPATGQIGALNSPSDIAVTNSGDLLISDTYSDCIREVPSTSGTELGVEVMPGDMYTLAGAIRTGPLPASITWVGAHMLFPVGIVVAADGSILYADQGANVVRELSPSG
jgi:hypothetical protein